ncbi:MAG: 4'-phosphopantetheinyl transferase superfamily protein [Pseudomonadota bacterium]
MGGGIDISSSAKLARSVFSGPISAAATDPRQDPGGLMPEEAAAISRAAPKRKREFAAGRLAARRAMAALGHANEPLPMASDRTPVWPEGLVGGISHTDRICLAVAARRESVAALGIDVEGATALSQDLWDTVLTPSDQSLLRSFPRSERGLMAKIIFSAKECTYKCQYAISRKLFGFDQVDITLDIEGKRFWAVFNEAAEPFQKSDCLAGNFALDHGLIVTGMSLDANNRRVPRNEALESA